VDAGERRMLAGGAVEVHHAEEGDGAHRKEERPVELIPERTYERHLSRPLHELAHGLGPAIASPRVPRYSSSTWVAIGAAVLPPAPPCSTSTTMATSGSSDGAKPPNQPCERVRYQRRRSLSPASRSR